MPAISKFHCISSILFNVPFGEWEKIPRLQAKTHVHLFVSVPPQLSISKVMGRIKGKTSRKLLSENRRLAKEFWGRHLWGRGYFAASSGNVTDEVVIDFLEDGMTRIGEEDMKNLEERIKDLSPEFQQEVLDFVEFLL